MREFPTDYISFHRLLCVAANIMTMDIFISAIFAHGHLPRLFFRYATSVGSKALTIKQACVLAVIFEFAGSVLAGSAVADTIRKGIADYGCYQGGYMDSAILMYGNLCVVASVALWLGLASFLEMPVSTTHSCVGGMIGMTIVAKGKDCVVWTKKTTAEELYIPSGVVGIVLSWIFSPVLSGIFAVLLFLFVRTLVLRTKNAFSRAILFYPVLIWLAVWINSFFVIAKGIQKKICDDGKNFLCYSSGDTKGWNALGFACAVGFGVAVLCLPLYKKIKIYVQAEFEDKAAAEANQATHTVDVGNALEAKEKEVAASETTASEGGARAWASKLWDDTKKHATYGMNVDIHASIEEDEKVQALHDNAEKFDPMAEAVFRYIQVFTAICDSFAHGANDVANAMGPFMAIYVIYDTGKVSKKADVGDDAYWILALGGAGIGIGLLLYGYKIMRAIGVKLAVITPSRGFSIELGAAIVIIIGSYLGLPLSTTHCQVGATTGVALLEGANGINKWVLGKTCVGWVITLIVVGFSTGLLMAQGINAPITGNPDEPGSIQYEFLDSECDEFVADKYDWLRYVNDTLLPEPRAVLPTNSF
uniref:Phosphate transporter n=1 Tax=Chrysotila carterae TaxID=13221 RepID=A0A7S4F6K6_CHRCT